MREVGGLGVPRFITGEVDVGTLLEFSVCWRTSLEANPSVLNVKRNGASGLGVVETKGTMRIVRIVTELHTAGAHLIGVQQAVRHIRHPKNLMHNQN